MPIFTDKRELPTQRRYKKFTGKTSGFGKAMMSAWNPINYVPGGQSLTNQLGVMSSSGDVRNQLETTGRKEALANDIQTAGTYASVLAPGVGTLASIGIGAGTDAAANEIRDPDTGKKLSRKERKFQDAMIEDGSSALANDVLSQSVGQDGIADAQKALDDSVEGMSSDDILSSTDAIDTFDDPNVLPTEDNSIAIDLGLEKLYVDSLGNQVLPQKYLRKFQSTLIHN